MITNKIIFMIKLNEYFISNNTDVSFEMIPKFNWWKDVLYKVIENWSLLSFPDVPNPPQLLMVTCNTRDASVEWQPMGDNRAPILGYIIQYNTSFTPDTWESAFDSVPATSTEFTVSFS